MSIGLILLVVTGLLIVFGVGQRALDRLRLNDRQALLFIALIIGLGFVPDIPLGGNVTVNLGGCAIPVILCGYLFVRAGTWMERGRAIAASLVTGTVCYIIGRYTASEPDTMTFDPNYLYGIAGGVIAYLFGRSRRAAFIAGVLGVLIADVISAIVVWNEGVNQTLALGGAGAYDAVVISGLLAVMLAELIGEIVERMTRGSKRPNREYSIENGEFLRKERQK
jgi:membrane-associated HD superfamily phosphohydrolase